jgi:hypothetical protein
MIDSVQCKTKMLFKELEERGSFKAGEFAGVVPFYSAFIGQVR